MQANCGHFELFPPGTVTNCQCYKYNINSWLSRCSAARRLFLGHPRVKIKACKYFLITEVSLKVDNKEHLFDFVVTLYSHHLITKDLFIIDSLRMGRSIVRFVSFC